MDNRSSKPPAVGDTRRDFIKKTATAAAAVAATGIVKTPVYGQSSAPSTGRVIGANDRIAVAVIGVGYGIGQNHIMGIQEKAGENNVVLAAGCDLYSQRRAWMQGKAEQYNRKMPHPLKESEVYADYRRILEKNDIDAVVIATHDPWHAPISIAAMEAGKHVYCEKPMTRYLGEAFKVHDAVKRTGRVFTVGSQGCSAGAWHKAAALIQAGKIGQLVWAQGYYCRNNPLGEWNYTIEKETTPENLNWDMWLGQVSKRPFSADAFHRWR
jgi:predicted dehydrogenase